MHTPASIAGHPIHPMLVPIAIGGFVLSAAADVACLVTGRADPWNAFALYAMVGGIVGALAAALPGLVDLLSLPAGAVRKTAVTHMSINLLVVALFICNAWMRWGGGKDLQVPMMLTAVAILLLLVSGWLGGKLVFEHGVGMGGRDVPR